MPQPQKQPQSKFDSGHVIVPVVHPSGELHTIAIPESVPMTDFHDALADAGYHFPQPTKKGALENTPSFRGATREAVMRSQGFKGGEAGFVVGKTGGMVPVGKTASEDNKMAMPDAPWIFATLHIHPDRFVAKPSDADIAASQKTGKPYYVASREGLFMVRPSDGQVIQVFDKRDWFDQKPKK